MMFPTKSGRPSPTTSQVWLAATLLGAIAIGDTNAEFYVPSSAAPMTEPQGDLSPPHPSIARIRVSGAGSESLGSGTLVGVTEEHGYVLSNWHVVRDAEGPISVEFPDGFRSAATVLQTDDTWDLALLLIWRPQVAPMPLAASGPVPGEPLIIAGYGQGPFRAMQGVFTDYASPTAGAPLEMFEVSVAARQGDSGGPIVNARGELAGVLFGAGDGRTTGTQVSRVRAFLDAAVQPAAPAATSAPAIAHAPPAPSSEPGQSQARQTTSPRGTR